MQQIGFVGLGAMGSVMAPLPVAAGFSVLAFDTASQLPDLADITIAVALTDLATCDAIITMLPDGTVVADVTIQLAAAGFRGLVIDMSSSHPDSTIQLGTDLAAYGIRLIDAPVSGGVKKAANGSLMVMAGGSAKDIAAATKIGRAHVRTPVTA